jgi:hypothetical protein
MMKCGRIFIPVLALISWCVCAAQENRPGPDPVVRATAQALRDGRVTDAEKILTDAVHQLGQSDPESPRLADYLERLGVVLSRLGRGDESAALNERAYEIDRKAYGPTDLRITHDLITQAMAAHAAGDNQEAEPFLNQALEAERANAAKLSSNAGAGMAEGVLGPVVSIYIQEQRWIEAEALLPELSRVCGLIDEAYRAGFDPCGRLPEVVAQIRNAEGKIPEFEGLPYSGNLPQELEILNKSAKRFEADGLYPSAEDAYNHAIVAAEKLDAAPQSLYGGLDIVEINFLGQLFEKEGFKDRAEQTYLRAFQIQEKRAAPEMGHPRAAGGLSPYLLVELYRSEGRLAEAEPLLQDVIRIQIGSLGERNRQVVQSLLMLAGIYRDEGKSDESKYAKAEPLFEQALAIQEANLGPDHLQLLDVLGPYADLLEQAHETGKAAEVRARMARITAAQKNAAR